MADGFNWDTVGERAPAQPQKPQQLSFDWDSVGDRAPVEAAPTPSPIESYKTPPSWVPSGVASAIDAPNKVFDAAVEGAKKGWGGGPSEMGPRYKATEDLAGSLRGSPVGDAAAGVIHGANLATNTVVKGLSAIGGAIGGGAAQVGTELGSPRLGRDVAGYLVEGGNIAGPVPPGPVARPPRTIGEIFESGAAGYRHPPPGPPPLQIEGPRGPGPRPPSTGPTVPPREPPPPAPPAAPPPAPVAAAAPVPAPRVTFFDPTTGDYRSGSVLGTRPDGRLVVDPGAPQPWVFVDPASVVATPDAAATPPAGTYQTPTTAPSPTAAVSPQVSQTAVAEPPPAVAPQAAPVAPEQPVATVPPPESAPAQSEAPQQPPPAAPVMPPGPPPIMPAGSIVHVPDLMTGALIPATVTGYDPNGDLLVDTGDGQGPTPANPGAVVPVQIAPMPPEPRSALTIQEEDGVGGPQAIRRARAERASYEAATGIKLPPDTRGDLTAILADPRPNEDIQAELDNGGQPVPVTPNPAPPTAVEIAAANVVKPTPAPTRRATSTSAACGPRSRRRWAPSARERGQTARSGR